MNYELTMGHASLLDERIDNKVRHEIIKQGGNAPLPIKAVNLKSLFFTYLRITF